MKFCEIAQSAVRRMIAVLLAAARIEADCLQMPGSIRADPDSLPRGRDRQRADTRKLTTAPYGLPARIRIPEILFAADSPVSRSLIACIVKTRQARRCLRVARKLPQAGCVFQAVCAMGNCTAKCLRAVSSFGARMFRIGRYVIEQNISTAYARMLRLMVRIDLCRQRQPPIRWWISRIVRKRCGGLLLPRRSSLRG